MHSRLLVMLENSANTVKIRNSVSVDTEFCTSCLNLTLLIKTAKRKEAISINRFLT